MRSNAAFLSKLSESVANESSSDDDDEAPVRSKEKPSLSGKAPKKPTALEKSPLFLKRIAEIAAATEDPSERDLIHTATATVLNGTLESSRDKSDSKSYNHNNNNNLARGGKLSSPNQTDGEAKGNLNIQSSPSSPQDNYNGQSPKWQPVKSYTSTQQPSATVASSSPTPKYTVSPQQPPKPSPPPPLPESPRTTGKHSFTNASTLSHKTENLVHKSPLNSNTPRVAVSTEIHSPPVESPKFNRFKSPNSSSSHEEIGSMMQTESPKFVRTQSFDTLSKTPRTAVSTELHSPSVESPKFNRFNSPNSSSSQQDNKGFMMQTEAPKFVRTQSFDTAAQNIKGKTYSGTSLQHVESPRSSFHKRIPSDTVLSPTSLKVHSQHISVESSKGGTLSTSQKSLGQPQKTTTMASPQKSTDATSARVQAFFSTESSKSKFLSPTPSPQGIPNKVDQRNQVHSASSSSTVVKSLDTGKKDMSLSSHRSSSPSPKLLTIENRERDVPKKDSNQTKVSSKSSNSNASTLTQNALFLKRQAIVAAAAESSRPMEDPVLQDPMGTPSPAGKNVMGGSSGGSSSILSPTGKDKMEKKTSTDEAPIQSNPLYTLSQSSLFLKRVALVNVDQRAVIEEKFIKGVNPNHEKKTLHMNTKMESHETLSDDGEITHKQTAETDDGADSTHSFHDTSTPSQNQSESFEMNSFDVSRSFHMEQDDSFMDESWGNMEEQQNYHTSNESIQFNIQYEFGSMKQATNEQGGVLTSRSEYESFFQEDFSRSFDDASVGSYSNAAVHKTAFTNDQIWENLFTDLDETTQRDSTWGASINTVFTSNNSDVPTTMGPGPSSEESYSPWNMSGTKSASRDDFDSALVFLSTSSDEKMIRDLRFATRSTTLPNVQNEIKPHSRDVFGFDGNPISTGVVVDKSVNADINSYIEHDKVPYNERYSEENYVSNVAEDSIELADPQPTMSQCKPYSILLSQSSKADLIRISAPTLVNDFMSNVSTNEHRQQDEFSVKEDVPTKERIANKAPLDPSFPKIDTARNPSFAEWNEQDDFEGSESGDGNALSPYQPTETVSQWWKNNYAASQGADVNKSVNEALFTQSPKDTEMKSLNDTSLFSTKSEEDIFSGIQDATDGQDSKNATPMSQLMEGKAKNEFGVPEKRKNTTNEDNEPSFIPPFASERKTHEQREYPKYLGDLMTATSDITFDVNSRRERKPPIMKETDLVSGKAYHKTYDPNKPRTGGQKPITSNPSDGNLDTSALLSLLAGKITCGALGPLMAAFDDTSANNKLSGGISTSGRRGRKYHNDNEDTTAIMEAGSDDGPSYEDESHVGSEISSRVHLSKKEKRVWDSWERKDSEHRSKSAALSPFTDDESQLPESMNNDMRRMKHQEKRAIAHEKLLLHAYAALSLLPNNQNALVNNAPFSVMNSPSNNKQALERFCQGVKSGMAILKLNRDKKWHLRFLTVSQEGSWLNNGDRTQNNGYFPLGLLWVKKMNKIKGHSISSIDADGRGGLLLADVVRIEECDDIADKFPLTKKQLRDYPDSVAVRLQVDHKGQTRFVTFRCSKVASTVIITGCQAAIALLGDYRGT